MAVDPRPILRPSVKYTDSVEKCLEQISYLALELVELKKPRSTHIFNTEPVKRVIAGPSLWRTFICTPGCVACCLAFTRDYFPGESAWEALSVNDRAQFKLRAVAVNNEVFWIRTVDEMDKYRECQFLTADRPEGGKGCGLWPHAPLQCAIAPQLQITRRGKNRDTFLLKKGFSRGWRWKRKPQCAFHAKLPVPLERLADIHLLHRLDEWAHYFNIKTVIPHIIDQLQKVYIPAESIPPSGVVLYGK